MARIATVLTIALALAGALFASARLRAGSDDAADVERGRAHIEKTCARCHPGPQLDALLRKKVGDAEPAAVLDGFLAGHHAADPALRADVLAALTRRLAGGE